MANDYMPTYDDSLPHPDSEYEAYLEFQGRHGNCDSTHCYSKKKEDCPATLTLDCYRCGTYPNPERRAVVRFGAVVNPADPTQTYVLSCGHITI
jgi:hypothetical protein